MAKATIAAAAPESVSPPAAPVVAEPTLATAVGPATLKAGVPIRIPEHLWPVDKATGKAVDPNPPDVPVTPKAPAPPIDTAHLQRPDAAEVARLQRENADLLRSMCWQLEHAGELRVVKLGGVPTELLGGLTFRHYVSDPVQPSDPALLYFLQHPGAFLVVPAECHIPR